MGLVVEGCYHVGDQHRFDCGLHDGVLDSPIVGTGEGQDKHYGRCVQGRAVSVRLGGISTATTDTLVVDGDAAADSISWETASHQIGNSAKFVANTTNWLCFLNAAATSTTIASQTIVTA